MKITKKMLALTAALISVMSIAGCSGSSDSGKSEDTLESYEDKVEVASTEDIEGLVQEVAAIPDGADGTLKWLSYFDINPSRRVPEKRTDLTLFEEKAAR